MKHFNFFYLSLVLMSMLSSKVFAYDFSAINDGTTIYYNYVDGGVCVTYKDENYNAYSGEVRIPSEVSNSEQEYNVVSIGDDAFQSCSDLTSVEIPSGLLTIGAYAFGNCSGLTSIEIPNSVTSIGEYAFWGCTGLTSVRIPAGVTNIGLAAFSATLITSFIVERSEPFNLTQSICSSQSATLYVPYGTRDAYIAAGWTTDYFHGGIVEMPAPAAIGDQFTAAVPCGDGTADLTFTVTNLKPLEVEVSQGDAIIEGELIIPATVTYNGADFAVTAVKWEGFTKWNSNPYSVVLPEGLTTIWDRGFSSSNVTAVTLPSTLTDIYQGAFMNCVSLSDITLPDGLTKIALATFQNTPALKSINLPEGITIIEHDAFRTSGLESVKFPTTLKNVGIAAFRESKLASIDFNGCSADIEAEAFLSCRNIEELEVPATATIKGWSNFYDCTSLKRVVLPNSDALSNEGTFHNCLSLETVTVPAITSVGSYSNAFGGVPREQYILFNIPEGNAETFLQHGYANLSDLSGMYIVQAEFEAEAARIETMADAFSDGEKVALATAISEARAIVEAANGYVTVYEQIAAIKSAAKSYLATATLTKGADISAAYITNADFDRYDMGWEVWGRNSHAGWQPDTYENGDVTIDKFVEIWESLANFTENEYISQTLTALPAGIYHLECDAIATRQTDAEATVTGVSLYAGSNTMAVATEDAKPQHYSLKFEKVTDGDMEIGLRVSNANANWIALDNVRLYYEGNVAILPESTLASDAEAQVYAYNVETGKYLSAGHANGTHAILDTEGLPLRLTKDEETGLWQIYFWEGSKNQQLLFRPEGSDDVWVDYDGQGEDLTWWSIAEAGDGTYIIQNKTLLGTESYLGNDPTRLDNQSSYAGVSYTDIIATATLAQNIHWTFFTKEQSDLMAAKHRLMAAILRMEESGDVNEDLMTSAQAVYSDANATVEEVIAVTTQLNSQLGMPKEDAPVDMTALIVNPRFENNTTEGWTGATVVGGRSDATSNQCQEFYEKNFNMYQTVTGVPNGIYRLKWKGFHRPGTKDDVYAAYTAGEDNASAVVYAGSVQKTLKNIASEMSDTQLDNTDYEGGGRYFPDQMEGVRKYFDAGYYADELEVEVTDNTLTIGVKNTEEMGTRHWVIFSDFELEILQNAETYNNRLSISDVSSVPGGSATLPIKLENTDQIVSFSAEVRLPEGIVPKTDDNGNIIVKKSSRVPMNVSGSVTADGTCRFAALTSGQAISGNGGEIFSFVILPAGNMELGDYEVRLDNVKLINDQLLRIQPFDTTSTITLKEAASGDVNGDGDVDILDATMIVYYVLGRNPSLNLEAGDVNGDGDVDILDATIIVYRVLGKNVNAAKSRQLTLPDPQ